MTVEIILLEIGTSIVFDKIMDGAQDDAGKKLEKKWLVWQRMFLKSLNTSVELGAGGSFSEKNGDPDIRMNVCILAKVELNEKPEFKFASGSVFDKESAELTAEEKNFVKELEGYLKEDSSKLDKEKYKKSDFFMKSADASGVGMDMPSDSANQFYKQYHPIVTFPIFTITLSGKFDVLYSFKALVDLKGLYAGSYAVLGSEVNFGLKWGFRKKIFGIPRPSSFFAEPYGHGKWITEAGSFAGFKYKDMSNSKIGGRVIMAITPVAEFRVGAGIGTDFAFAQGDFTVGIPLNFALPVKVTIGVNANLYDKSWWPYIYCNGKCDFVMTASLDARVFIEGMKIKWEKRFPIYEQKPWTLPILDYTFYGDTKTNKIGGDKEVNLFIDFVRTFDKSINKFTKSLGEDTPFWGDEIGWTNW